MKRRKSGEDSTINCPRCHRPNPVELIYCAALDCAAVLHPGRTACDACRAAIPVTPVTAPTAATPLDTAANRRGSPTGESGPVG